MMQKLLTGRIAAVAVAAVVIAAFVLMFSGFGDAEVNSASRCQRPDSHKECPKMTRAPELPEGAVASCYLSIPWLGFFPGLCSAPGQPVLL